MRKGRVKLIGGRVIVRKGYHFARMGRVFACQWCLLVRKRREIFYGGRVIVQKGCRFARMGMIFTCQGYLLVRKGRAFVCQLNIISSMLLFYISIWNILLLRLGNRDFRLPPYADGSTPMVAKCPT